MVPVVAALGTTGDAVDAIKQKIMAAIAAGEAVPADGRPLSAEESASLRAWAQKNVLWQRGFAALRNCLSTAQAAVWEIAVTEERGRIAQVLNAIHTIHQQLEMMSCPHLFTKASLHWPDMGHDIDLLIQERSGRADAALEPLLGLRRLPNSLTNGIAGKQGYAIAGRRVELEIHHGLMGHVGEFHRWVPGLLQRRRSLTLNGISFPVPSPEDQLLIIVQQRVFGHFYVRASDLLAAVQLCQIRGFDWQQLEFIAAGLGLTSALRLYLSWTDDFYGACGGGSLPLPSALRSPAAAKLTLVDNAYRFSRLRALPGQYLAKLWQDLRQRDLASLCRLAALPGLFILATLRNRLRSLAIIKIA